MTGKTLNREELHRTFGGIICESDFCTDSNKKSSNCAKRIVVAWKFDELCRRHIENRKFKNN